MYYFFGFKDDWGELEWVFFYMIMFGHLFLSWKLNLSFLVENIGHVMFHMLLMDDFVLKLVKKIEGLMLCLIVEEGK